MTDWSSFVRLFLVPVLTPAAIALTVGMPLVGIVWVLRRKKRRYLAAAKEPFTELPLRPPGESLRLKIEELTDSFDSDFANLAISLATASAVLAVAQLPTSGVAVIAAAVALIYVIFGRRLCKTAQVLWSYRLGYTGERVVGEELNQLLAAGFRVFHDLPFEGFNVDHVIVGPSGVYVIETKTRRKPTDLKGLEKATVVADGGTLQFPKHNDFTAVEQTRRNARTVSEWLTRATGERVVAQPILTLPGWWVTRRPGNDVNVLNPTEIKYCFPARPARPLGPEQIQRIAHQLSERCRLPRQSR